MLPRRLARQLQAPGIFADVCVCCNAARNLPGSATTRRFASRREPKLRRAPSAALKERRDKIVAPSIDGAREGFFKHLLRRSIPRFIPPQSITFVAEAERLPGSAPPSMVMDLARKHKLTSFEVLYIADLLGILWDDPRGRLLSLRLFMALAKIGHPDAVMHLYIRLLRRESHVIDTPGMARVRESLEQLASRPDDINAKCILGQLLEREGRDQEAIDLYREGLQVWKRRRPFLRSYANLQDVFGISDVNMDEPSEVLFPMPSVWNLLGTVLIKNQDKKGAMEAFRFGVEEADDPAACYYYGLFQAKYSRPWVTLMIKASASGHVGAMFNLGQMYAMSDEQIAALDDSSVKKELLELGRQPSYLGRLLARSTASRSLQRVRIARPWSFHSMTRLVYPSMVNLGYSKVMADRRFVLAIRWLALASSRGYKPATIAVARLLWETGLKCPLDDEGTGSRSKEESEEVDPKDLPTTVGEIPNFHSTRELLLETARWVLQTATRMQSPDTINKQEWPVDVDRLASELAQEWGPSHPEWLINLSTVAEDPLVPRKK